MIKMTGLLALFGCCVLAGFLAADKTSSRTAELRLAAEFFRRFQMELKLKRQSPLQTVSTVSSSSYFDKSGFVCALAELSGSTENFSEALEAAVEKTKGLLPGCVGEILSRLEGSIGVQPLEAQLEELTVVNMLLSEAYSEEKERSGRKAALFRRLGVLGGLLAVTVMI